MVEHIKDELELILNSVTEIRNSVSNEIKCKSSKETFFFENITAESKENLMNIEKKIFEIPNQKISCNEEVKINTEKINKISPGSESDHPDVCVHKTIENTQVTDSDLLKENETKNLHNGTNNQVLKTLQIQLKNTLTCIEFLKQGVIEQITLANAKEDLLSNELVNKNISLEISETQENGICKTSPNHNLESDHAKSDNIETSTKQINNESEVNNKINCSSDINMKPTTEIVSSNKQINNETEMNNKLNCSFDIKMEPTAEIVTSNNALLSNNINCHEKIMISLISDDDSNSDCSVISISCTDQDENLTDTSAVQSDHCSTIKSNNTSINEDQITLESNDTIKKSGIDEVKCEAKKRRSDSSDKKVSKKKRNSKKNGTITNEPSANFIFGEFYKVKLTNLPERISYADIALILQNAGLEFIDILLINHKRKSYAEISFTEKTTREKAISLDKSLSYLGMKIKIRPL